MNKQCISLLVAILFSIFFVSIGQAASMRITCEVVSVEGNTVTMNCGKQSGKLNTGDKVKVKAFKKKENGSCG